MVILTLNCGSSSAKYQVYDWENKDVLAVGVVERIGLDYSTIEHNAVGKPRYATKFSSPTHKEAIELIISLLLDKEFGVISDLSQIGAVGHRVLHGGEIFKKSTLVTDEVVEQLKGLIPLGPLHMPANIMGIEAARKVMPSIPHAIVMDTAWHQTMPPEAYMYAVPYEWYTKYNVRRYGFHGTSHRYITKRYFEITGKKPEGTKLVICHLGNGSSLSAVKDGKVLDTSMGLTPLDGFIMGTRCGGIDPSVVTYVMGKENLTPENMSNLMNKKSGFLGISGISNDCRDLQAAAAEGNERAQLALDMFTYQIKKFVGGYAAAMGGIDAIIFTGGIGENSNSIRSEICSDMEFLGLSIGEELNKNASRKENKFSSAESKVEAWVIPTNEEIMIARDTVEKVFG